MIESLEARQLLAATLGGGVLRIVGTLRDDVVSTRIVGAKIVVSLNSKECRFPLSKVDHIIILGDKGNDFLTNGAGHIPARIDGGPGNDVLCGGLGNDTLIGGTGNDRLYGQAGDDILSGCQGDDLLDGGDGNDSLTGGIGNDTLYAGDGLADTLNGSSGRDSAIVDGELDVVTNIRIFL
jgi:Ca2+-binding RTX toxin-like protein